MSTADAQAPQRFGMLRTIALYKLVKVLLLVLAAYGESRLHDASLMANLVRWGSTRPSGLEHDVVTQFLEWFSGLSESKVHALRAVTLTYAALFAVEGIGLWMRKRWAEWFTTIITASLIPLEVWELVHRPSVGKAAVVIANAAIVGYLIWHVRSRGGQTDGPVGDNRTPGARGGVDYAPRRRSGGSPES